MKRFMMTAMLVLALIAPIFAISIEGTELENPFGSEENLALFSFEDGKGVPDLSDWEINLVTTRTGGPVYAYFGHTSLEIVDPEKRSHFFDYGFFTFSEGFYGNFIKGLLYYNMYPSDGEWRIRSFTSEDRTVWRTPLALTDGEKYGIIQFLNYNALEENNTYLYHYYNDNCATRVRDIINSATHGEFRAWAESIETGYTLRSSAAVFMDKNPIASFAINALEGPSIDEPITLWEAMYLPEALERGVEMFYGADSELIYETTFRTDYRVMPLFVSSLLLGIVLSVLMYTTRKFEKRGFSRVVDFIVGILYIACAVVGLITVFMMTATNHDVAWWNANVLYLSPLLLISGFEALRGKKENKRNGIAKFLMIVMIIAVTVKLIFPSVFIQSNWPIFALLLPIHFAEIMKHKLPSLEKAKKTR